MSRGKNRKSVLGSRICGSNKNAQTSDSGNRFSKTDSPTKPLPSWVGVGETNSQELIFFFLGILLAIQDAASGAWQCPDPGGPSQHSKLRQK